VDMLGERIHACGLSVYVHSCTSLITKGALCKETLSLMMCFPDEHDEAEKWARHCFSVLIYELFARQRQKMEASPSRI
jgi:hypothetical protein